MVDFPAALLCVLLGLLAAFLHGCGGAVTTPAPAPPGPPAVHQAPNPADMSYRIPPHKNFNCIKKFDTPTGYKGGFFIYRWTTKREAETDKVDSDVFGDINPYYLLTELMTNTGGSPPQASKQGTCVIPKCGADPAMGGCVLERVFLKMNNEKTKDVLTNGGIWGPMMIVDNGIADEYSYWAFNWTGVENPNNCKEGLNTPNCNFYFEAGYPVGCQTYSDVGDTPIWYSTVAACPQYPFDKSSSNPTRFDPGFQAHGKQDASDPATQACKRRMPGGNYCGGPNGTKGDPWTNPSPTCTWQTKKAGYLTIEDIFNVDGTQTYNQWCEAQPEITTWGYGTGIPYGITLFYNLSDISFPVIKTVRAKTWQTALAVHNEKTDMTPAQIAVFKNWAVWAKVRLNAMFDEMDKQAFAQFNKKGVSDPDGNKYTDCISWADVAADTPVCTQGAPGATSFVV